MKAGYPTRQLSLVPELPVSSLGLKGGDQIIVTQKGSALTESNAAPVSSFPAASSSSSAKAPSANVARNNVASLSKMTAAGSDYVDTGSGVLVHRVGRSYPPLSYAVVHVIFQVVPDDNSCLFSSVALVFEGGMGRAQSIRRSELISVWSCFSLIRF